MTICAAYVVAPVFTATEVVVFLFAGMTAETGLRGFFGRFRFEGNDFLWIAFFEVSLAWSMTRLAAGHLSFPTVVAGEAGVRSMRERFELVFVTVFASLATHVLV